MVQQSMSGEQKNLSPNLVHRLPTWYIEIWVRHPFFEWPETWQTMETPV